MLSDLKFTEAELAGNDISSLPDRPGDAGITTAELKARFDAIPKTLLALGKYNALIDALTAESGAGEIGAAPIEGIEGGTVQAQLNSMSGKTAEAAKAAETAATQGTAATQAAEAATQTAADAAAKAQAATEAAQTAAAQGEQAAEAAQLATTTVTEVKAYAKEQAQSAKEYVDQAILDAGAVTSVFGRAGAVMPQAGDYTAEQVSMEGYDNAAAAITEAIEAANTAGSAAASAAQAAEGAASAAGNAQSAADAAKTVTDTKGAADGLATLDADAKVTAQQASAAIVDVTESRALAIADAGRLLCVDSVSDVVLTVPIEADVAFPVGTELEVCQLGAGAVSFAAADGVTLLSAGGAVMVAEQYGCVTLKKLGADKWLLAGMLG